ncbi:MAG: hypothetical protein DHS20C19_12510 [Acidimicrobiales bacterium]|nr:MAG: hypothetical protein DHS20C19_12510 [Acidimicrobiales bacterium]
MGRHVAVLLVVLSVLAASCGDDGEVATPAPTVLDDSGEPVVDEFGCAVVEQPAPTLLPVGELIAYENEGAGHEGCPETLFSHSPPTSGNHFGFWQNCGFYTAPIRDYAAVHSLEHGVVWIAYQPDLTADEVGAIEARMEGETHLLAAPYPGLENPIVLSAWTRQLAVDRWSDPLVEEFLGDFTGRLSTTAPEAGASCDGALGAAPDQPLLNYEAILASL